MRRKFYILQLIILCSLLLPYSAGAVSYTYDLVGNRITMTDPIGTTTYTYDVMNRVTSITNPNGEITTYTYDAVGRRISATLPNGIVTTYAYDAGSRLTALTHTLNGATIASFTYTYDGVGNRVSMTDSYGTHNYTYDPKYQLIQATHPNQPTEVYSYDAVGNRLGYVYNAANQLLEDDNYLYSYDKNGNTTKRVSKADNSGVKFIWTVGGNLAIILKYNNMNDSVATSTAKYIYDGLGRRVAKNVDGNITKYVYDGEDILFETDASNQVITHYTHGPGIDEPISVNQNGQTYYYLADGLGSIVKLVDSAGNVVNSYTYDSFGNINAQNGSLANPYTYTGREYDAESGLYYYRFRYYDPKIGRFISLDPILQLAIQETPELLPDLLLAFQVINQYVYVNNNPINRLDPYGLWYGTTGCSYYVRRCNETGHWYYCWLAPKMCSLSNTLNPQFTNWDECTRECLQEYDQLYCRKSNGNGNGGECDRNGGAVLECAYEAHAYCFKKCWQNPYQRPPFLPKPPGISIKNE